MGALPSTLKTSSRTLRRRLGVPKSSSVQAQAQAPQKQQQQQQQSRTEEGRTQDLAGTATGTTAAAAIPQVVGIDKSATAAAPSTQPLTTDPNPTTTSITTQPPAPKMASDEDYAAFLEKANADPNEGYAKTQDKKGGGTAGLKAVDAEVPKTLKDAVKDQVFVSDSDEPFEPVSLRFDGDELPDEVTFAKLVNHPDPAHAAVEILDVARWDARGEYKDLVRATREATKGSDVIVYRVAREGARVEYFLVGREGGKILGVKALAVES